MALLDFESVFDLYPAGHRYDLDIHCMCRVVASAGSVMPVSCYGNGHDHGDYAGITSRGAAIRS